MQDASNNQPWTGTEAPGSAAMAAATLTGVAGFTPTGAVAFALYANGSCAGTPAQRSSKNLTAGQVPNSDPTGPLAAGAYSMQASYSGDADYQPATCSCRPFTVPDPYIPITPRRLFDTRNGTGVNKAPLGAGGTLTVQVAGTGLIPATATAVALNLTAVGATAPTFLTVWPHGTNRPATSNLNPTTSAPVANFAIVSLDPDGAITIWNQAGSVNVLADIAGYTE